MAPDRIVHCAWCESELHVGIPQVGRDGYFLFYRRCRSCDGANRIEVEGIRAESHQHRRRVLVTRRMPLDVNQHVDLADSR